MNVAIDECQVHLDVKHAELGCSPRWSNAQNTPHEVIAGPPDNELERPLRITNC